MTAALDFDLGLGHLRGGEGGGQRRAGRTPAPTFEPSAVMGPRRMAMRSAPLTGERHPMSRDPLMVPSLGRARGEAGHGLAAHGAASETVMLAGDPPALGARGSSSRAASSTPALRADRAPSNSRNHGRPGLDRGTGPAGDRPARRSRLLGRSGAAPRGPGKMRTRRRVVSWACWRNRMAACYRRLRSLVLVGHDRGAGATRPGFSEGGIRRLAWQALAARSGWSFLIGPLRRALFLLSR